jgi:hypothetical protein
LAAQTATGFGTGEFVTISLTSTAATTPTATDFLLSAFNPIDVTGIAVTGLSATVSDVTTQQ